ncbi:androglobin-like isoform X4 [Pomacea canaliculata]|uniref:androglobin-like isoform X4 n=1 Tax=Pomacea canaliculata TaxID=400727 RepID=UPI000D726FDB|nr:androglobin-like isoform X4 [Pomacea canaliculata]
MVDKSHHRQQSLKSVRIITLPEAGARANSAGPSAGIQEQKRPKITIWPEWSDADVNAEKWDAAHKGKEDKKGKSPTVQQHFFEDPDGRLEVPSSLRVDHWKRPQDFLIDKMPVVVDVDSMCNDFDLVSNNEHLHESELMRYIISQVTILWKLCTNKNTTEVPDPAIPGDDPFHTWRPWEHIYSLCKVAKHHIPLFNPLGKYIVKLYWMGCWRKILVDDLMPFDENEQLLLPVTSLSHELWPMILAKALIKAASLDYSGGSPGLEFGDFTIIHCLTGWLPELIPLQYGNRHEIWQLLKSSLPEWQLPEHESAKSKDGTTDLGNKDRSAGSTDGQKEDKIDAIQTKDGKSDKQEKAKDGVKDKAKDKEKGGKEDKKDKKDKEKDKEKDKIKEKVIPEETPVPEKPEVVVFAMFGNMAKYPVKVSMLREMANASEHLRQNGLNHLYPHTVCVTQTRSCPLEPPPPPEIIPAWKLIRPRKKKPQPTDEPKSEPEVIKDIRCLEITSPFVNYKISPVPIPVDTFRCKSALERGSTHSRPMTGSVESIQEMDENDLEADESKTGSFIGLVQTIQLSEDAGSKDEKQLGFSGKQLMGVVQKQDQSVPEAGEIPDKKIAKSGVGSKEKTKNSRKPDGLMARQGDLLEDKKDRGTSAGSPASLLLDSGLSVPREPVGGEPNTELKDQMGQPEVQKSRKVWMDLDEFCICFKTLYIFHKPHTYAYNQRHSDLRNVNPTTTATLPKADKKISAATVGQVPGHDSGVLSGTDDKSQFFLFVDSLMPIEIIVSFSVLARWFDQQQVITSEEKRVRVKDSEKEPTLLSASSPLEGVPGSLSKEHATLLPPPPPPPVTAGTLVAEPYSWKSLVTGHPILRIKTTGTRAAVLTLPAGRHVLRFIMTSPLGYHVHMCSIVNFIFGDEETVMPYLTNESCRFRDNALQVIMSLGKCIKCFGDAEQFSQAWKELVSSHCPYLKDKLLSKQHHFQVFNEALYSMLRKALQDIVNPELALAWRSFNFDLTSPNILGLPFGHRPETSNSDNTGDITKNINSANARSSAKVIKKQTTTEGAEPEKTENTWAARYLEPTAEDHVAAVKIQKVWRGHRVRRVKRARTPGTGENAKALEQLQKSWAVIEPSAEENGLLLFREMFKMDSDIMCHYPFHKDEWSKISYADYKGICGDQPLFTWFIVFREIFFVKEEMLVVPKLYVPIPTCMLHVIDNDSGQELPRVFHKVAPYVYKRNKKGYTFVAEARTLEQPLMTMLWRMRLIGSLSPLPAPRAADINSDFFVKEIRDYYVPNSKNIILRYSVKVTEEQLVSLQMTTSKHDVYVRLCILDNEEEVISAVGKGHVVIAACILHKDMRPLGEEAQLQAVIEPKRSTSRTSTRGGPKGVTTGKGKQNESAADGRQSESSQHSEIGISDELEKEAKPHKYIVQATVLRNSWPLSESSWVFVQTLKEQEKNELKDEMLSDDNAEDVVDDEDHHDMEYKERLPSPPKTEKSPPAAGQKGKPKGSKPEKGSKDKASENKGSRPSSQQFDLTKPHWSLRVVIDAGAAEEIEVKKDTERADEIRALKKAWEDAEPGRAAKALQSRLKYLSTHTIKLLPDKDGQQHDKETTELTVDAPEQVTAPPQTLIMADTGSIVDSESVLTLEPPAAPAASEILQPLDLTPFLRKTLDKPHFLDEDENQRLLEERQRELAEYKEFRQQVEAWRAQDQAFRNYLKLRQLEDAQHLQTKLDIARGAINVPREAYRQRHLEAERKRQEELAAQEAAQRAELEAKPEKGNKSGKKSAGDKKKK